MVKKHMIVKGDTTTHGGTVLEGSPLFKVGEPPVACVSHQVSCPQCKGVFPIVEGSSRANVMGLNVALEGMQTACGAILISSQTLSSVEVSEIDVSPMYNRAAPYSDPLQKNNAPAQHSRTSPQINTLIENSEKKECEHYDQALDIATYILDEIRANVHSNAAKTVMYHLKQSSLNYSESFWKKFLQALATVATGYTPLQASHLAAEAEWTKNVMQDAVWDHKKKIATLFPSNKNSTRWYHKYGRYEYYYDIWSNIHYGYLGAYCGFSESRLLDGAGLEQIGSDIFVNRKLPEYKVMDSEKHNLRRFDDKTDYYSVKLGITLFNRYNDPQELPLIAILDGIDKFKIEIGMAPDNPSSRDKIEESKLLHRCFK